MIVSIELPAEGWALILCILATEQESKPEMSQTIDILGRMITSQFTKDQWTEVVSCIPTPSKMH